MSTPIKLRAEDGEDLTVISACLQDAILPVGEMCYEPAAQRFVAVFNRFRWESADGGSRRGEGRGAGRGGLQADDDHLFPFERVQCGVRFDGVVAVKVRGLNLKDRSQILELLSLGPTEAGVVLTFAGGGALRLDGANWRCVVEDLGEPWPTSSRPCHGLEDEASAA